MNKIIIYEVKGMTCAACVSAVEKSALKVDGILEANVSLPTEQIRLVVNEHFDEKVFFKTIMLSGYKAQVVDDSITLGEKQSIKLSKLLKKVIIALVFMIPLMYVSMGHMVHLPLPDSISPNINPFNYALVQMLLTLPIMAVGYRYYVNGFRNLVRLKPNMDTLVAISTITSFLYGVFAMFMILSGQTEYVMKLYFESAAMILLFIMLGKYLEQKSTAKTTSELEKLMALKPQTAIKFDGNTYLEVPMTDIQVGDVLMVRPGDTIPTDGVIKEGHTTIDEAMMTGESLPKEKQAGETIIGGTINITDAIIMTVSHIGEDTILSVIIKRVSEAQMKKAPIQKLVDIISGFFVPIVMVIAFLGFMGWYIATKDFTFAMNIFVSVLVIACPCALGLATPTAIMTASGQAAKHGVLISTGEALEVAHKATLIAFDKTGTITTGKLTVQDIITTSTHQENELLQIAASLEVKSSHPIATAIKAHAKQMLIPLRDVLDFENHVGLGIKGQINNQTYIIGNEKWMLKNNIKLGQEKNIIKLGEGKSYLYIASDHLIGLISVSDTLKNETKDVINRLHEQGIETLLLSGDDPSTVDYIAKKAGIKHHYGGLLPEDKQTIIKNFKKDHTILMVGDGINDAIALKEAHLGIAMAEGTDVALSSGDVVLMQNNLTALLTLIELSQKTTRNIKENLFWAFIYNLIGIPLALGALMMFNILLNPMIAALMMSLSSVSVVLNALRLKRFKGVT